MDGRSSFWRHLFYSLAIIVSYFIAAKIGLSFAVVGKAVSPVWPPAGVALASLLLLGLSYWPAVFIAACVAMYSTDTSLMTMLAMGSGSTLEAAGGAYLLEKVIGRRNPFSAGKDVFFFFTLAGCLGATVAASIGILTLFAQGITSQGLFSTAWFTWFLGDLAGIVIVTPFVFVWFSRNRVHWTRTQLMELVGSLSMIVAIAVVLFSPWGPSWATEFPASLITVPWLLWISLRFGVRGISIACLVLYVLTTYGTINGHGPYIKSSLNQSLIYLQLSLISLSISSLVIAAVIAEKDRIFRKLMESEQRLRAIFNHSFQHIGLMTPKGIIVSASQSSLDFVEAPLKDVAGKDYRETVYGRLFRDSTTRKAIAEGIENAARGEFVRLQAPLYPSKGGVRYFDMSFKPVFNNEGRVEYIIPEGRDITDLKKSQEELRTQANLLHAIIEGTTEAIFAKDRSGRYLVINSAGAKLLGRTPEQVIGRTDFDLFVQPSANRIRERDLRVMENGNVETYEESTEFAAGTLDYLVTKGPYIDCTGAVIGTVGIARDITERKKIENDLRRSNIELEHFAYIASHDLQEPLRMVISHLQLLEKRTAGKLDADSRDFMHYAIDGARRMRDLIQDLLAYSRVARREVDYQNVDCNALISKVLFGMKEAVKESGAIINQRPLPSLKADPARMAQLMQNLIGNAIKYRRADALPQIEIGAEKRDDSWHFWVRDNGIGIPKEFQNRIFTMFQRLHSREHYPGTGIGLAICKKVVEQHGGQIWIDSNPGLGSTFYFSIPRRANTTVALKSESEASAAI